MRTLFLGVVLLCAGASLSAQNSQVSSTPSAVSSREDVPAAADPGSLDRIREGLGQVTPLQETMKRQPTFKVMVEERGPFDELLATLDLKRYPPVPGGLYAAEIQRLTSNPVDHPLAQPYAAFSGPELLTIAVENLVAKYLGGRVVDTISNAERARAEAAARAEVAQAVTKYCAALPDHGLNDQLCRARLLSP
jgi:hypothetical protein